MPPEDISAPILAKKRCRTSSTISPSLLLKLTDAKMPLPVRGDVASSTPASPSESRLPEEAAEVTCRAQFNLDYILPAGTSSLDSTESTLLNSLTWDESLFDQYLHSPSPEVESSLMDEKMQRDLKPDSEPNQGLAPSGANVGNCFCNAQKPEAASSKIHIRLRVEPIPALSKTKIILRYTTSSPRKGKGRHQRKMKSRKMINTTKGKKIKTVR